MNIVKLYFKIVYDKKTSILTYLVIFTVVFGLFTAYMQTNNSMPDAYESVKTNIAFIDHDQSAESALLKEYLHEKTEIKQVGSSTSEIQDALFYDEVDTVVQVPKGFGHAFRKGKENLLDVAQRPDSAQGMMLKQQMNAYLQRVYTYQAQFPNETLTQIKQRADADLKVKSKMQLSSGERINMKVVTRGMYFNYMSYVLLAIILMVVGLTMHSVYRSEILKRNSVSPTSSLHMNSFLVLSNILFGIIIWLIMIVVIFIFNGDVMMNTSGMLLLLNSLLFAIMTVTLAFMFSALTCTVRYVEDVMNGISNVVSLGFSFLGGAFVPQHLIPSGILTFAKLLPSYWYVNLNDALTSQMQVDTGTWTKVWQTYGVLSLFAITFFLIGLVIMRKHRSQDEFVDNNKA